MNFLSSNQSNQQDQIRRSRARAKRTHDAQVPEERQQHVDPTKSGPEDWTGLTSPSPSSSDFETISDSEFVISGSAHGRRTASFQPSNLGRSLRSRGMEPEGERDSSRREDDHAGPSGSHSRQVSNSGSRDGEGDDEFSALEEDEDSRGRTRRRRDENPNMKKSLLEDALRSSLATLLSLSVPAHHLSQSPALSQTNLTSLIGSHSPSGVASPHRPNQLFTANPAIRPSQYIFSVGPPEAGETVQPEDDEEGVLDREDLRLEQDREDARQWEEEPSSTSEVELVEMMSSSSDNVSDDEGTQLAPRSHHHTASGSSQRGSRAIPIVSSSRQHSRARSDSDSHPSTSTQQVSPLHSRTLGLAPSSGSPPTWSRRRRRRGRRSSFSPGPATVEERRRARGVLEGDADAEDRVFADLADATSAFISMSPRHRVPPILSSGRSSPGGTPPSANRPGLPFDTTPVFLTDSQIREKQQWTPDRASSPASSFPSSDPHLADSIPTLDFSSGPDEADLPLREVSASPKGENEPEKPQAKGWWWGRTIEIKVWHLVGLAGLLIGAGVGLGALSFLRSVKPARIALYF